MDRNALQGGGHFGSKSSSTVLGHWLTNFKQKRAEIDSRYEKVIDLLSLFRLQSRKQG